MKIQQVFFANIAVIQFTFWFNKQNKTKISAISEHKEGVPFVTIDFGNLNPELVFQYAYNLGKIQKDLISKNIFAIDDINYPLPSKEDELYKLL